MRSVRPFLSFLALAVGLLFAASQPASAATVKYPTDGPVLTFELPSDWTTKEAGDASKGLYCIAPQSEVQFQLYMITDKELAGDLPAFAKAALKEGGLDDAEIIKSGEKTMKGGMSAKFAHVSFKTQGKEFASLFISFSTSEGQSCVIHCFLLAENLEKNEAKIDGIIDSIKLIK